jgi:hypothetical protein
MAAFSNSMPLLIKDFILFISVHQERCKNMTALQQQGIPAI